MYSPGAPSLGHEIERRFWQQIATGIASERAVEAVGISQAVGPAGSVIVAACHYSCRTLSRAGTCHLPNEKR